MTGTNPNTEYRAACYDENISELVDGTNVLVGSDITSTPIVQATSSSPVYQLQLTVIAKYC